jgi:Fe-S cluster assembly protein SufB
MATETENLESLVNRRYEHGFVTDIDSDSLPPGLDEGVVRAISARKNEPEFMLEWRLRAYRMWLEMREPNWAHRFQRDLLLLGAKVRQGQAKEPR